MKEKIEKKPLIPFGKTLFLVLILFVVTIGVYVNSIKAPFILDDTAKILGNPDIRSLDGLFKRLVYPYSKKGGNFHRNDPSRPLVYLSYALNYHFGGLDTVGYHIINMILHALNAVLIFLLTRKIWKYFFGEDSIMYPLAAAVIFAVHPVNSGTVSYVSGRSVVLGGFFYLTALVLCIRAFEGNRLMWFFSLVFYVLALLTRQDSVTLAGIVFLVDYLMISRFDLGSVLKRKNIHLSFWFISILYILLRYVIYGGIGDLEASDPIAGLTYFLTQPYVILKYIGFIIIPKGLSIDHIIYGVRSLFELRFLVPVTVIFLVLSIMIRNAVKIRKDKQVLLLFAASWFLINISPTSSFLPTTAYMVENRLYLSGYGIYLLLLLIYIKLFKIDTNIKKLLKKYRLPAVIMILYIVSLGIITIYRNRLFNDPFLIWNDVVAKYADSPRAHFALGNLSREIGEYEKAIREYRESIKSKPNYGRAHLNLGIVYSEIGDLNNALKEYNEAIRINPEFAEAYACRGNIYYMTKNISMAVEEYKKAIEINPNSSFYHNNLGLSYARLGNDIMALKEYTRALQADPEDSDAYYNTGKLYYRKNEFLRAIDEYKKSLQYDSDQPSTYGALALAYEAVEEYDLAILEYKNAIDLNPNYIKAHKQLGGLYMLKKKIIEAIKEYEIVLKLDPDNNDVKEKIRKLKGIQYKE